MPDAITKLGAATQPPASPPAGGQPVGVAPNVLGALNRIAQSPYFPRQGMERMAQIQRGMAAPFVSASAPNILYQLYQRYRGQPNQLAQIPPNAFRAMGMLLPILESLGGEEAPVERPSVVRPASAPAQKTPSILEAAGLSPEEQTSVKTQAQEEAARRAYLEQDWPHNKEGLRINEADNPFHSVLDQHVHDLALHGGYNAQINEPGGDGWYALMQNGQSLAEDMGATLNEAEHNKLVNSAGAIVHHGDSGIVTVKYFPDPRQLGRAWGEISAQVAGPPPTAGPPTAGPPGIPEGSFSMQELFGSPPKPGPSLGPTQLEEFVRRMLRQREGPGPVGNGHDGYANGNGGGR